MLVATQRNGTGSASKLLTPSALLVSSCRKSSRFEPVSAPWKPRISPSRMPISSGSGKRSSRCFSRNVRSLRGGESENIDAHEIDVTIFSISAGVLSIA